MSSNPSKAEVIKRAWDEGRAYERENLLETLEHLRKETSVEPYDAALVLKSLIAVIRANEKAAGSANA